MHDYYRIAKVSRASARRRTHVPAWAFVSHATPGLPRAAQTSAIHLVRALEPERPSRRADVVLRDEVALDFPSTRQALDHARRDFAEVEAPGVDLSVDVVLTPLEARRSKRVPLCLHLPCLCDACGGRGGTWNDPCATCAGEGTAPAPRYVVVRIPASSADGARLTYRFVMPYGTPVRLEVRLVVR